MGDRDCRRFASIRGSLVVSVSNSHATRTVVFPSLIVATTQADIVIQCCDRWC